jgi:hypothetical protein
MRKKILLLFAPLALAAAFAAPSASVPAKLAFPTYGFSINPLETADFKSQAMVLAMYLPPVAGSSPNVNVLIQPYPGSMADYIALSKSQFGASGVKVLSEKQPSPNEWEVEYTATLQNQVLHFFARAISVGGRVYLGTGTAPETMWPKVGDQIKSCVASLQLFATAPAVAPAPAAFH